MTTFTAEITWTYLYTVQIIFDFHRYRKIFIRSSLIINVFVLCIPCQIGTILFKSLITFDILDIFQIRFIT